jgi:mitochondrial fission protein ELM1
MRILIVDDGNKGNFIQSIGLAKNFFNTEINIISLKFRGFKYSLYGKRGRYPLIPKFFNILCFLNLYKIGFLLLIKNMDNQQKEMLKKEYDFVINTGSYLSSIGLLISKVKKSKYIQIMLPSFIPLKKIDFLIIPYHDFLRIKKKKLKNLIITNGSLNPFTKKELEEEGKILEANIKGKNKKIIGILIGGDDQNYKIDIEWGKIFIEELKKFKNRYDIILSTSKRTSWNVVNFLKEELNKFENLKYFEIPQEAKISYYKGIIGLSDIIFVTEDSINMIFESLTGGKPVIVIGVKRKKRKLIFDYTIEKLIKEDFIIYIPYEKIFTLEKEILNVKKGQEINEAKQCVQKILEKLS